MEYLHNSVRDIRKKQAAVYSSFAVAMLLIAAFAVMESVGLGLTVCLAVGLAATGIVAAIFYGCLNARSLDKQIQKLLRNKEWKDKFIDEFPGESAHNLLACCENKQYALHMCLTQTWFVFISTAGSSIARRSDLLSVEKKLIVKDGKHAVKLCFRDGTTFVSPCYNACDVIIETIEQTKEGDIYEKNV